MGEGSRLREGDRVSEGDPITQGSTNRRNGSEEWTWNTTKPPQSKFQVLQTLGNSPISISKSLTDELSPKSQSSNITMMNTFNKKSLCDPRSWRSIACCRGKEGPGSRVRVRGFHWAGKRNIHERRRRKRNRKPILTCSPGPAII